MFSIRELNIFRDQLYPYGICQFFIFLRLLTLFQLSVGYVFQKAVCEICGKTLDSIPPENSSTGQHKPAGVICEPCAKDAFGSSIYSSDYNTNSEKWELSQEEEHRCDICGEVFLNQQSLGNHKVSL